MTVAERATDDLLAFLAQTLRIAMPYLFAAAGGVMAERAGMIGLTLEGYMLGGAFCAALGSYYARRAVGRRARGDRRAALRSRCCYAVATHPLQGRPGGGRHRDQSARHRADAILPPARSSTARRTRRACRDSAAHEQRHWLRRARTNPLVWLGLLTWSRRSAWLLYRTPFGLRVRAVGEHPEAAASVGVP